MADIELVIKMPESILNTIQADEIISREQLAVLQMHILNGKPFPKGHGRLIDVDELNPTCRYYKDCSYEVKCDRCKYEGDYVVSEKDLTDAPTIIGADDEESEVEE